MTQLYARIVSRTLMIAVLATSCQGSDDSFDSPLPTSSHSSSQSYFGSIFSSLYEKLSFLISSSSSIKSPALHSEESPLFQGVFSNLLKPHNRFYHANFNPDPWKTARWMHYTHLETRASQFSPMKYSTLPAQPLFVPVDIDKTSTEDLLSTSSLFTKKGKDIDNFRFTELDEFTTQDISLSYWQSAVDQLKLQLEQAKTKESDLKIEHQKEISLLKRAHAEKELSRLHEIKLLKEQLHALQIAHFTMPLDFNPAEFLELHPTIKEHTERKGMTVEQAHNFATEHFRHIGGPIKQMPYKRTPSSSTQPSSDSPKKQITLDLLDDIKSEEIREFLLNRPDIIIEATLKGFDLEEYAILFLQTISNRK